MYNSKIRKSKPNYMVGDINVPRKTLAVKDAGAI